MGSMEEDSVADGTTHQNGNPDERGGRGSHTTPFVPRKPSGRSTALPLDVGTRVHCRWRDGKYHPVKVIERRKVFDGGLTDYEYYVHYTECEYLSFC